MRTGKMYVIENHPIGDFKCVFFTLSIDEDAKQIASRIGLEVYFPPAK